MEESKTKLFQAEREKTDNSLIAERAKATHSLSTANVKSQTQTDEIVKDERFIADQKTASSRADHDGNDQSRMRTPSNDAAKAQLAEERRRTDIATGLERSRMDKVLLAERNSNSKLVAKVLEHERTATDQSLLDERNTTDEECVDNSNLLKSEVAKHKETQMTLTSREEFLAIVSHDLKNPIGAIGGYADLILGGDGDTELGPETLKFVHAIKRNADISLRLIADLLDLERIAQGKLPMKFSKCDANEIVRNAVDIFRPQASEKKIELIAELPDKKLEVECDHDRILQAISNLIGNALKFTPEGGTVRVSAKGRRASAEFSVQDSGCGIPLEMQDKIFNRFTQLGSQDRAGLGLGLYIAKTIVASHSGSLTVDSTADNGSTFHFALPTQANVAGK